MADMCNAAAAGRSSSPPSPSEPEDFSLFLNQILLRSSSSSSSIAGPTSAQSALLSPGPGHRIPDIPTGGYFPANVSSSSVGTIDNDLDEYDCESEEGGFEAIVEEVPAKAAPSRNPAKRSRAAEVHNLSEKRRRSRINEKMKALQDLIPNSNKTDKASMLDEAIEYLKQLQLQVQMLTMRNGLSLYPVCLPGVSHADQLPQMNMALFEGNGPLNIDLTGLPHEGSTNAPNHSTDPTHVVGPSTSSIIHSCTSLGLGSSVQAPIIPTQLPISSMVANIFREDVLPDQRRDAENFQTNLLGSEVVNKSSQTLSSYEPQSSHRKNALEALALGSRGPQSDLLTNLQSGTRIPSRFHSMSTGTTPDGDLKYERSNF